MAENPGFKKLRKEHILQAFEKTSAEFDIPGIKLVLITEVYYDLAMKFAREHFITNEPLNKALGMQWTKELEDFMLNPCKLHISLMFIDEDTGEPVAFMTVGVVRCDDEKVDIESIQYSPLKELQRFWIYGATKADFFGHFPTKEAFHIVCLGVAPKYKQRGLATKIFNTAVDMIQNFGIDPVYIRVEGSSNYSKKIFEKAGCVTLFELPFDTWEVDGKFLLKHTDEHTSMKCYGIKLRSKKMEILTTKRNKI